MSNKRHQQEIFSVAKQAAHWLLVMKSATAAERDAFWQWLNASPLHVREMLLAARVQRRLSFLDRECGFDVDAFIQKARSAAPRIGERMFRSA